MTQAEVARALGVSKKAVESYEQGWREIPERTLKLLLTFVVMKRAGGNDGLSRSPCWEVMNCPASVRETCMCGRVGDGRLCWLLSQSDCRRQREHIGSPTMACVSCPVLRPYLDLPTGS